MDLRSIAHADIAPLDAAYVLGLGTGEAAVISYAAQHQHFALVDDRKARKIAALMRVQTVGSGAVLLALKASGHIAQLAPALGAWGLELGAWGLGLGAWGLASAWIFCGACDCK